MIYEEIREALKSGKNKEEILDQLRNEGKRSILRHLIKETEKIIENKEPKKKIESYQYHFLVRKNNRWVDISDGRNYEEFTEIPWEKCKHGLCQKKKASILKRIIKSELFPNVFISHELPRPPYSPITVTFKDGDKKISKYTFDSYQIYEFLKYKDIGDRKLAAMLCANTESIVKLRYYLEKKKIKDDRTESNKGIKRRKRGINRSSPPRKRKNAG